MLITDIKNPSVQAKFLSYPESARNTTLMLRQLILEVASLRFQGLTIEETLKWNEPSYLMKGGSTIRINWRQGESGRPDVGVTGLYFNCNTTLVETFKTLYRDRLIFSGNRGILFSDHQRPGVEDRKDELAHCIELALNYHKIKHLPLLGA